MAGARVQPGGDQNWHRHCELNRAQIRGFTEHSGVPYIRINVREPQVRGRLGISVPLGGAEALTRIDSLLTAS